MRFTLRVLWATLVVIAGLAASVTGILGWAGISPNEAKEAIQVVFQVSATLDVEGVEALVEFVQELEDRALLDKWGQVLEKELR